MYSARPARASSASRASANPTASKPIASACPRIASRIAAVMGSAATTIGRDAGIGQPQPRRRLAGLVENIDRDTAARIPVASDAQPARRQCGDQPPCDRQRAVLVKRGAVAERAEEEFQ